MPPGSDEVNNSVNFSDEAHQTQTRNEFIFSDEVFGYTPQGSDEVNN